MSNYDIYCSKQTRSFLEENEIACIYLPQYSPELAPVELFIKLKKNYKKNKYLIFQFIKRHMYNFFYNKIICWLGFNNQFEPSFYVLTKHMIGGVDSILKFNICLNCQSLFFNNKNLFKSIYKQFYS